ncbi:MAG: YdeI/OmpD-associated family protein [Saprospiraceae bacterium]|nr:YdeI/OmpD-associated family protein [Saprospiraceae bacterium]
MPKIIFEATLKQFENSSLWGWHFIVPTTIAQNFINGNDRRVTIEINNEIKLHSALMPNKETWFIMLNQGVQKKLNVKSGGLIQIGMDKDTSEYGMPMPDEFREVLDQNPEGDEYFHGLTPGKQRSLLYIVGKVKNIDLRINKALAIVDHLTINKGKIDYKMLNEALKYYGNM